MPGFRETLTGLYPFSEEDWETTGKYFEERRVAAKARFITEGEVADRLGFVETGLLRSHIYTEGGRDVTLSFFHEGTVAIAPESFDHGEPAGEYVTAYEDSKLLTITRRRFRELGERVPVWHRIGREVAAIKNRRLLQRVIQFQTLTAAERYESFLEEYPGLLLRVPLGHVASYLGMDIATLSRLRSSR